MNKTEKDAVKALMLIDRLVRDGCTAPNQGGGANCFWCLGDHEHAKDCAYVEACELRGFAVMLP